MSDKSMLWLNCYISDVTKNEQMKRNGRKTNIKTKQKRYSIVIIAILLFVLMICLIKEHNYIFFSILRRKKVIHFWSFWKKTLTSLTQLTNNLSTVHLTQCYCNMLLCGWPRWVNDLLFSMTWFNWFLALEDSRVGSDLKKKSNKITQNNSA